jgi:methyltransferase (TIGR00027 family)
MQEPTSLTYSDEAAKKLNEIAGPGSRTAMGALLNRFGESQKPEGERICYDPCAVHFIDPSILEWEARNSIEAKALREQRERLVPGLKNSIIARVRYFDDFVQKSIDEGLEQMVILGAGYDSRAYRFEGLKKIRTFEIDHPATQIVKIEKIKKIFGDLPDHVAYIPIDFAAEDLGRKLLETRYDRSQRTLFLMEGLLYYIPPIVVDGIMSFIVKNSGKGSIILFDYFPQSVVDGSCSLEVGRNIHNGLAQIGEPLQFGIEDGTVERFLAERGFSKIKNVTSEDYMMAYFHGVNEGQAVCSLMSFVHAVVE